MTGPFEYEDYVQSVPRTIIYGLLSLAAIGGFLYTSYLYHIDLNFTYLTAVFSLAESGNVPSNFPSQLLQAFLHTLPILLLMTVGPLNLILRRGSKLFSMLGILFWTGAVFCGLWFFSETTPGAVGLLKQSQTVIGMSVFIIAIVAALTVVTSCCGWIYKKVTEIKDTGVGNFAMGLLCLFIGYLTLDIPCALLGVLSIVASNWMLIVGWIVAGLAVVGLFFGIFFPSSSGERSSSSSSSSSSSASAEARREREAGQERMRQLDNQIFNHNLEIDQARGKRLDENKRM